MAYQYFPSDTELNELPPQLPPRGFKPRQSTKSSIVYSALGVGSKDGGPGVPEYRSKSFSQKWFGGLPLSLRMYALVAGLVLIVNGSILIWAHKKFGLIRGYGTIQKGDCQTTKTLDLWLHLGINVLSTLVFMGSNAFMQAYSSPTRLEIDKAHRRRGWLHIGVLSFRNLRGISKRKGFVCILLALSSIPFHLLYDYSCALTPLLFHHSG
jgi:hypothetical protein